MRLVPRDTTSLRRSIGAAAVVALLALPGVALGGNGLIDQYIEDVPTAGGTHHPGAGSGGTNSGSASSTPAAPTASLPGDVQAKLEANGGKDTRVLREIATSPSYGAPPETTGAVPAPSSASPDAFSAAVGAVTDGSDGRMLGLFVALLAVTTVSLGFGAARRRRA